MDPILVPTGKSANLVLIYQLFTKLLSDIIDNLASRWHATVGKAINKANYVTKTKWPGFPNRFVLTIENLKLRRKEKRKEE
jgi:hypothetical protein